MVVVITSMVCWEDQAAVVVQLLLVQLAVVALPDRVIAVVRVQFHQITVRVAAVGRGELAKLEPPQ